jgi:CBS domain-containing protein
MERPIAELLQHHGVIIHTSPESTVKHAVSIMAEHDIGSVLVFRNNTELLGIFTERDLLHRVVHAGLDPATTPLREVMTEDVVVVSADTPRGDVIDLMREEQFRHVPVAQDGQLVGVVSLRDALRFENRQQAFEIEQLREYVLEKPYPTYPG